MIQKILRKILNHNFKSICNLKKKPAPIYEVTNEKGLSHQPEFSISCKVDLLDELVIATGSSKQKAEQTVAAKILMQLENSK